MERVSYEARMHCTKFARHQDLFAIQASRLDCSCDSAQEVQPSIK